MPCIMKYLHWVIKDCLRLHDPHMRGRLTGQRVKVRPSVAGHAQRCQRITRHLSLLPNIIRLEA